MEATIGVIVTLYNKEKYIIRALESIYRQTSYPDEVIIINDCSTDSSLEIVEKWIEKNNSNLHISIIDLEKNVGAAQARNLAIDASSSDYLLFLDADDQYESNYINTLKNIVSIDDTIGMVISRVEMESNNYLYPSNRIVNKIKECSYNGRDNIYAIESPYELLASESLFVGGGNCCFSRKAMSTVRFNPKEKNFEEWNFYYRIMLNIISCKGNIIFNSNTSYIYNDLDQVSLSRKGILDHKDIRVPELVTILNSQQEYGYRSLLISIWLYSSVSRLSLYFERIKFIVSNFSVIRHSAFNRYFYGTILRLIIPMNSVEALKNKFKEKWYR